MSGHLGRDHASRAIETALPDLKPRVRSELERVIAAAGAPSEVAWHEIDRIADDVAQALESRLPNLSTFEQAGAFLDTATMLRVRAGGAARRGGPFTWRNHGSGWEAVSPAGKKWEIIPRGRGWGIIVANWDWPDWSADDLEEAKRVAEEIDARPAFPRRFRVEEPY